MDLRAEPMVLSVPELEKSRYYSVMLCDGNTYNYGYIGSRATGPEAGDYLVAGPDWKGDAPSGIKKVFRSSTQFSLVAYRTQLFSPDDMPNVVKIQSGYKVQPLSQYLNQPPPSAVPAVSFPKISAEMVKFDFKNLSPEQQAQVILGMKDGEAKIEQYLQSGQKNINGWKVGSLFGDGAFYNGDWLKRAAAAKAGIYGNDAVEAVYPHTKTLANGEVLDGSKHNYTLTLAADQFPPVNAFWSVTMYDGKTQLLIENPGSPGSRPPSDVACHLGKRSPRFAPLRPRTSCRWCFPRTVSRETSMNLAKALPENMSRPASTCAARLTPLFRASASEDPTSFGEWPSA